MDLAECFKKGLSGFMSLNQEPVTLRTQTNSYNTQDDRVPSNSDVTVNAHVQILGLDDVQEYAGELKVGDAVVFFNNSVSPVKNQIIVCDSIDYEIVSIIPEYNSDSLVFSECHCRRYKCKLSGEI